MLAAELKTRCATLEAMPAEARYYFSDAVEYDEKAANKFLTNDIAPALRHLHDELAKLHAFEKEAVHEIFQATLTKFELKMKALAQATRVALTGNTKSPSIDLLLCIVDKERTLSRLKIALQEIQA